VIAVRYRHADDPETFFGRPESAYLGSGLIDWWRGAAPRMGAFDAEKQTATANQRAFLRRCSMTLACRS